jgi:ligand-binding SRPBCC domain-containing protein
MVRGAFRSFVHDHYFEADEQLGTRMLDELRFAAPLGALGWVAEVTVLHRYFLLERNARIPRVAESGEWRKYL